MDYITISKENLYTYSAKMRRSYEQDIARRAVEMFKRGYTLRTIMRTLSGAYSGFTRDMVRDIVGKALYDFFVEENKNRSENNERTVKSEHSRIYQR